MRGLIFQMPDDGAPSLGNVSSQLDSQLSLLRPRISFVYPGTQNQKHIKFRARAEDGFDYYCKADADGRAIRATEWIAQSLARHLGIAVPEFRVMEHNGETFFGSRESISTAGIFEVQDFLARKKLNELGGTADWLGNHLSRLHVLDMFLNNPDRGNNNFVLESDGLARKLCAIDFADARLEDLTSDRFPVAASNTVCNGKFRASVHGFSLDTALEMIDNIRDIRASVIDGIIGKMPNDWMVDDQKLEIREAWASSRLEPRLSALRAGLEDGSRR